jgi:hypothetical protein
MDKYRFSLDEVKDNPALFFSVLPEKAEKELIDFYNYLIYKYNIPLNITNVSAFEDNMSKKDFLSFLKNDLTLSDTELQRIEETQKEINKWKIKKF